LGFRVKEAYSPVVPGTFWVSASLQEAYGITAEHTDIGEVLSYPMASSIGGVIEDVRRVADNGFDPYAVLTPTNPILPSSVMINPNDLTGMLIRTDGDHEAFRKMFIETATAFFRDHSEEVMPYFENDNYSQCGYLDEIVAADYGDLRRYVRVIEVFTLVTLLLAMLGLLAICTWYASTNSKDIAIRKVFGGTVERESARNILRYMSYVLIALAVGIPVSILLTGRLLERWPDRISGYWWIYLVAALFVLIVSVLAVIWQTLKAAKTNPATELKKE
jgi:ABC-type antimicrobial peptide transport system permease subunit